MRPKFEVGEVVILQSVSAPQFNREHTVRHVIAESGLLEDRLNPKGAILKSMPPNAIAYRMEEICPGGTCENGAPCEISWAESALRKKHQPGELGFKDLMASLSTPKLLKNNPEAMHHG